MYLVYQTPVSGITKTSVHIVRKKLLDQLRLQNQSASIALNQDKNYHSITTSSYNRRSINSFNSKKSSINYGSSNSSCTINRRSNSTSLLTAHLLGATNANLLLSQRTSTGGTFQQDRNFSSITDYLKNISSVKAAEPTLNDTASSLSAISSDATSSFVTEQVPAVASSEFTPASSEVTAVTPSAGDGIEYIPLPPAPLPGGIDPSTLTALGEPSLQSLGLAGWSPVGLMQQFVELIHISGLPWWGSIAVATVFLRMALFPVVVYVQKSSARMNNVSPQMQALQLKITDARQSGDQLEVARLSNELVKFMEEKNVNPLKSVAVPLAQAPIFISMFVGLRRCANLPVLSMTAGGALWFTDLTVADPYYILPLLTSTTMFLTIKFGTEVGRMQSMGENAQLMMKVMKFIPVVAFPFMCNFPSAMLCYWLTTNIVSLGQASLLRVPIVRNALNIPAIIIHPKTSLPVDQQQDGKSAMELAKNSWRNLKVTRELQDRQRYDSVRFAKAGQGPIVKTYKFDPTKPKVKGVAGRRIKKSGSSATANQ